MAQLSGWLLPSLGPREGQASHSCGASLGLPPRGPCAQSELGGSCGSHRAMGWMGPGQPEVSLPLPPVLCQPCTRVPRHPQEPVDPASSWPDQISLPPAAPGAPAGPSVPPPVSPPAQGRLTVLLALPTVPGEEPCLRGLCPPRHALDLQPGPQAFQDTFFTLCCAASQAEPEARDSHLLRLP